MGRRVGECVCNGNIIHSVQTKRSKYYCSFLIVLKSNKGSVSSIQVNVDHILQVLRDDDGLILMTNNQKTPLSRTHKKELLKRLNRL